MNLQFAKYMVIAGALVVALAIVGLIAVLVLRGGVPTNSQSITGLISYVGILLGLLTALGGIGAVGQQLNGHLKAHEALSGRQGLTAEEIQTLIDQELERRGQP